VSQRRSLAVALAASVTLACGGAPSTFAVRFAEGERAETAGRHADAARAFDAASRASGVPERERQHAVYLAGLEYMHAGDVAAGTSRFESLVHARGEHAAQARWELVMLEIAAGAPPVARDLEDFIRTYPSDGLAHPALDARLRIARAVGGEAEALATLRGLAPAVERTDSAGRVAYQIAESLSKLGQLEEARAAFVSVADRWPYPKGEYFDDALYRASEVDEALGHLPDAVADLQRMLSVMETSMWPGTYVRPRFPDGGWRVAVLYRDKIGDSTRAIAAFERYVDAFPNALRRDEALWEAAKLLAKNGDEGAACGRLSKLVSTVPDSRYVPCAVAKCAAVARPKQSHAPERCHAYLLR
jgi:tetratricopeptide (TPR) repeat protein